MWIPSKNAELYKMLKMRVLLGEKKPFQNVTRNNMLLVCVDCDVHRGIRRALPHYVGAFYNILSRKVIYIHTTITMDDNKV